MKRQKPLPASPAAIEARLVAGETGPLPNSSAAIESRLLAGESAAAIGSVAIADAPADSLDVDAALEAAGWSSTMVEDDQITIVRAAPDSDDYAGETEPGSEWDRECDRILGEIREAVEALGWTAEWSDDDIHVEPRRGEGSAR